MMSFSAVATHFPMSEPHGHWVVILQAEGFHHLCVLALPVASLLLESKGFDQFVGFGKVEMWKEPQELSEV